MNFNKINLNLISLIITILIFLSIIQIFIFNNKKNVSKIKDDNEINRNQLIKNENVKENNNVQNSTNQLKDNNVETIPYEWKIKIPILNVEADIKQGTDEKIISKNVGHYEKTNIIMKDGKGKIALLAYNSGKNVKRYFTNLKDLRPGNIIFYIVNGENSKYKVMSNKIVEDDQTAIAEAENKSLLLFTYVIDMPNVKRCVTYEKQI